VLGHERVRQLKKWHFTDCWGKCKGKLYQDGHWWNSGGPNRCLWHENGTCDHACEEKDQREGMLCRRSADVDLSAFERDFAGREIRDELGVGLGGRPYADLGELLWAEGYVDSWGCEDEVVYSLMCREHTLLSVECEVVHIVPGEEEVSVTKGGLLALMEALCE